MEAGGDSELILSDLPGTSSLLVFCSGNEEEEQLLINRGHESEEPVWIVGNSLQFSLPAGEISDDNVLSRSEFFAQGKSITLNKKAEVKPEVESGETVLLEGHVVNESDDENTFIIGEAQILDEEVVEDVKPLLLLNEASQQLIPVSQETQIGESSLVRILMEKPGIDQSSDAFLGEAQGENATIQVGKLPSVVDSLVPESGVSLIVQNEASSVDIKENDENISSQTVSRHSAPSVKLRLSACSKSSVDEDEQSEECLVGPTLRWPTQPKSYRGAKQRDGTVMRKNLRKVPQRVDTDGETSGMGSSVDEPVESSTESASEAPSVTQAFLHPRASASRCPSVSPTAVKKRRGGWPKGRKRKPDLPGVKPPKAPLTAYVLFLNERRKYYKEMLPDLSFGAVTKLLGAEWSSMTAEQKAAFVTRSEQEKRRYRNELQAYRQSHDYQLLLRKKRIKNVIKRGGTTTEESSDFTDEIDDDESEELYCRICDQLFSSLHNKREHLYGKQHLQAITGEYQRERLAEEERQMAASSGRSTDCSSCGSVITSPSQRPGVRQLPPGVCPMCSSAESDSILTRMKQSPSGHTEEEDHDGDEEDEEEEEEEEEVEGEGEKKGDIGNPCSMSSVADALEGVMSKVLEREQEIKSLKQNSDIARSHNLQLATTLLQLREQKQELDKQQVELQEENDQLKGEVDALWMLPALFGVTPLDMVNITLRQENEQNEEEVLLDIT
ncbi:hypothetical protein SK128_002955 [Halocaridina rubra]|uniref:HMG box domain-containing protein n=1 Tax=Halocaridina rubra TaxID=373956 RepID=A0AAN8X143_HALRR